MSLDGSPSPGSAAFADAFNRIERHIEDRYQIPVVISDVLDPNTGDFDGSRILVDYDQDIEMALFVVIHLFGHTVQWNLSERYRQIGIESQPGKSEEELAEIYVYERDATRYSLGLLQEAGISGLDRWISDWWHADWRYLAHFYRTGEKLDVRALIAPGQGECLTPLSIPPFTPNKWVSRWSF